MTCGRDMPASALGELSNERPRRENVKPQARVTNRRGELQEET